MVIHILSHQKTLHITITVKTKLTATIAAPAIIATAQATHKLTMNVDNSAAKRTTMFKDQGASVEWAVKMQIFNADSDLYKACRDGVYINMNWHIHVGKPFGGQGVGAECGAMAGSPPMGGHYDPTFAYGPATDEVETCAAIDRSVGSDDFVYTCSPDEYEKNPYACEVGDVSGWYGALQFKINKHNKNIARVVVSDIGEYRPQLKLIEDIAITFHYGSPRTFCGTLSTGTRKYTTTGHSKNNNKNQNKHRNRNGSKNHKNRNY